MTVIKTRASKHIEERMLKSVGIKHLLCLFSVKFLSGIYLQHGSFKWL